MTSFVPLEISARTSPLWLGIDKYNYRIWRNKRTVRLKSYEKK